MSELHRRDFFACAAAATLPMLGLPPATGECCGQDLPVDSIWVESYRDAWSLIAECVVDEAPGNAEMVGRTITMHVSPEDSPDMGGRLQQLMEARKPLRAFGEDGKPLVLRITSLSCSMAFVKR